jgi:glycyl-tRNA synthetase beta chain
MTDLLLELFSEEIPARMQVAAIKQLSKAVLGKLTEARLVYGEVEEFSTPRRIAIIVRDLPDMQPDITLEKKAPKLNAPQAALDGFCKANNVEIKDLEIVGEGKDAHYLLKQHLQGQRVADILPNLLQEVVNGFHWPKSMRWGNGSQHWVRPLRSIVALFGEAILPLEYAGVKSGRITYGHRFMSEGEIIISNADEYEAKLRDAKVIANREARKSDILQQAHKIAKQNGLIFSAHSILSHDTGLLEEVTGLVEYPVVLCGEFNTDYLRLPPEVLVLEMRHHQKYFALTKNDGTLSNHFIITANIETTDGGAKIIKGNERVLKARLEDGAFYYEQDLKKPLNEWALMLENVIFHQKLGSIAAKVGRIKQLAEYLTVFVPHAMPDKVKRAAELCKADLTTGMVGEFPELQGIMGRYYAIAQGEDHEVAESIKEHYQPVGVNDELPSTPCGIVISLADKFDSLAGLFSAGEIPTGSKDPFALRRAALGIIRIVRTHELHLPLKHVLEIALKPFSHNAELLEQLYNFMLDRLRASLKDENVRYDAIEAILADSHELDLNKIISKIKLLDAFVISDDGANVLSLYKRASNILKKETNKYDGMFVYDDLVLEQEKTLVDTLAKLEGEIKTLLSHNNFAESLQAVATLRTPLDSFFEGVMVNVDDAKIRHNRLNILTSVQDLLHKIADFSKLEGI